MSRPIRKILIANRGEVARRVIRSCRSLGIRSVAVYSPPDAGAPYVAEADESVPLRGAKPAESYLDIDQLLTAAAVTGADAVHPGWGFLAENAGFATACAERGLIFLGPSPDAITRMGSKIGARALMEAAGVPVVPGATLTSVDDDAAIVAAGEAVGYPLLVKASAGGGGKGMRLVESGTELAEAVRGAAGEAASSFGDPTVFLERYVSPARHVEIQVVGDTHGQVVHLFERDCSVQRRHQKLVEEAPSPAVDEDLRGRMGAAAVKAAQSVDYHGVGTVEFLLGPDGDFYFLEMNTRLQVEHPVTEMVTGLDLVALQVAVAEGRPLPAEVLDAGITGHAVEVRLYAEDPLADYRPHIGRIEHVSFPSGPGLRIESGVETGSEIGTDYDSMLAKVVAAGPTRADAVRLLIDALERTEIHGLGTNRDLLVAILDHEEFLGGSADTGFLDRHPPAELVGTADGDAVRRIHAAAAALAAAAESRAEARTAATISSGFRNNPGRPHERRFADGDTVLTVGYRLGRDPLLTVDGEPLDAVVLEATPGAVNLLVDGVRRTFTVQRYGDSVHVDSPLGSTALRAVSRFPSLEAARPAGSLLAPMPGAVVQVLVKPGDVVTEHEAIVVLEAMKMQHTIGADRDGVVTEVHVSVGQQVSIDEVLAVVGDPAGEAEA
jgi:acetyl/propionyl-CoA carboxylase alpha subunit